MRYCHSRALAWRNNFVPYSANRRQVLRDRHCVADDAAARSSARRPLRPALRAPRPVPAS